mgnify:FL=1
MGRLHAGRSEGGTGNFTYALEGRVRDAWRTVVSSTTCDTARSGLVIKANANRDGSFGVARAYLNLDLTSLDIPRQGFRLEDVELSLFPSSITATDRGGDEIMLFADTKAVTTTGTGDRREFNDWGGIANPEAVALRASRVNKIKIKGRLREHLHEVIMQKGHFNIFLLSKLDVDGIAPTRNNEIAIIAPGTLIGSPFLKISYSLVEGQRLKRKAGGGGFGEIHLNSTGLSGFSGDK